MVACASIAQDRFFANRDDKRRRKILNIHYHLIGTQGAATSSGNLTGHRGYNKLFLVGAALAHRGSTVSGSDILLHIGYHKCASTVLQDQLFARADGPFRMATNEPRHALVHRFVVPQPLCFDPQETRAHYEPYIEKIRSGGHIPVLSHERFSGYPPSGGYDSGNIAERLHATFPEARILMLIREQRASIFSMYLQYITDGGELSLSAYLDDQKPYLKRMPAFSAEFYRYHRLLRHYRKLFGSDRVLCLPCEIFLHDGGAFVQRLCGFVDKPAPDIVFEPQNTQRSISFQMLQRLVNRHLSRNELSRRGILGLPQAHKRFGALRKFPPFNALAFLDSKITARMKAEIAARFDGKFTESNAITSELIGVDLAEFGYQTS